MGIRDRIRVVEIIRPTKSGHTQPYQCKLEDEQNYAVKGRGALTEGLLAEVSAAVLGQAMGLPIPDFVIAEIPKSLIISSGDCELRSSLGEGLGFASLWQNYCAPLTPTIRDDQSRTFLAKLYAFDHWIANGDRSLGDQEGNPNLLYQLADRRLVVFDHNLAFSPRYSAEELAYHAGRRSWSTIGKDGKFLSGLYDAMQIARRELDAALRYLPDEWIDERPNFIETMHATLDRVMTKRFWAELG